LLVIKTLQNKALKGA